MATKTKVRKGLSPEEKTLIDNLKSMIAELESMEMADVEGNDGVVEALKAVEGMAGTAPNEEIAPVVTPQMPEENEKPEVMGLMKEIPTSSDGSPGAQAKAEARVEDVPEVDEENIDEVAKALASLLRRKGVIKTANDPMMAVVSAVKAIADEVSVMKASQVELLKGMGIADQIMTIEKAQEAGTKPVASTDRDAVILEVAKALQTLAGTKGEATDDRSMAEVRKDMGGVLSTFAQSGLWNMEVPAKG